MMKISLKSLDSRGKMKTGKTQKKIKKERKKGRLKFAQISTLNSPLYDDDVSLPAANT